MNDLKQWMNDNHAIEGLSRVMISSLQVERNGSYNKSTIGNEVVDEII